MSLPQLRKKTRAGNRQKENSCSMSSYRVNSTYLLPHYKLVIPWRLRLWYRSNVVTRFRDQSPSVLVPAESHSLPVLAFATDSDPRNLSGLSSQGKRLLSTKKQMMINCCATQVLSKKKPKTKQKPADPAALSRTAVLERRFWMDPFQGFAEIACL